MLKKEVISWALYDFANTAFTSPFRTIFWPLLVTSILNGNEFQLGLTVALAIFAFSIIVPFIGAISDATKIRMPFIIIPTILTVLIIGFLPLFGLALGLILAGVAILLYNVGLSIYNTILPDIASEKEMGKISGLGMGFGFFGTIASVGLTYFVLKFFATDSLETVAGIKAVFPAISLFFLLFSLPFFLTHKDKSIKQHSINFTETFLAIRSTFKHLAKLEGMLPFLVSAAFFANALAAIDVFFFLFARKEIEVTLQSFILLFMAQSLVASFGAIFFGRMADKIGPKNILRLGGIIWIIVVGSFIGSKSIIIFWIAGLLGSLAFGGVLSASRTLFIFLTPQQKIGEFFGYSQIVGKFTGLFGPPLAGWLIVVYGYNSALIMVLILFVISFLFILKIPDVRKIISK